MFACTIRSVRNAAKLLVIYSFSFIQISLITFSCFCFFCVHHEQV